VSLAKTYGAEFKQKKIEYEKFKLEDKMSAEDKEKYNNKETREEEKKKIETKYKDAHQLEQIAKQVKEIEEYLEKNELEHVIVRWGPEGVGKHSAEAVVYYDSQTKTLIVGDPGAIDNNNLSLAKVLEYKNFFVDYIADFRKKEKKNE